MLLYFMDQSKDVEVVMSNNDNRKWQQSCFKYAYLGIKDTVI